MSEQSNSELIVPNAWRVSADIDAPYFLVKLDSENLYSAVQPGDALVLMDEAGEKAWGVRKVFLVRHANRLSYVYFNGGVNFDEEVPVPFAGTGDKTVLRKLDLSLVEQMLSDSGSPKFADLQLKTSDERADRTYVRGLLETIVVDDLQGPAGGPNEEIVGMSVRDRYILGRLGPRKRDVKTEAAEVLEYGSGYRYCRRKCGSCRPRECSRYRYRRGRGRGRCR